MELEQFLIFKNKEKKAGSNQPDYRITTIVDGKFENWGAVAVS